MGERSEEQKHIFSLLLADKAASNQAGSLLEEGPWAAQQRIEMTHFQPGTWACQCKLLIPRPVVPGCHSDAVSWVTGPGRGVMHHGPGQIQRGPMVREDTVWSCPSELLPTQSEGQARAITQVHCTLGRCVIS